MNRPRLQRLLRISWTVCCITAAMLLIALWVRSNSRFDSVDWSSKPGMYRTLFSQHGHLTFVKGYNPNDTFSGTHFDVGQPALEPFVGSVTEPTLSNFWGVRWYSSHGVQTFREFILAVPHWLLVVICAAAAILPWMHNFGWRFSLRTLLIAMTLIAVGLGVVVYLTKTPTTPPVDVGDFDDGTATEMTH